MTDGVFWDDHEELKRREVTFDPKNEEGDLYWAGSCLEESARIWGEPITLDQLRAVWELGAEFEVGGEAYSCYFEFITGDRTHETALAHMRAVLEIKAEVRKATDDDPED